MMTISSTTLTTRVRDVGQSAAAAALPALIAGLHGAAVLIASIVQIYAINARNGVGHIILHRRLPHRYNHGLQNHFPWSGRWRWPALPARGAAEAIAVGQVVVAVRVLRRLHPSRIRTPLLFVALPIPQALNASVA